MGVYDTLRENLFHELPENTISLDILMGLMAIGILLILTASFIHFNSGKLNIFGLQVTSIIPNFWQLLILGAGVALIMLPAKAIRDVLNSINKGE